MGAAVRWRPAVRLLQPGRFNDLLVAQVLRVLGIEAEQIVLGKLDRLAKERLGPIQAGRQVFILVKGDLPLDVEGDFSV